MTADAPLSRWFKKVLTTAPTYRARFANVWRWSEWQGRDNGDIGIDIVNGMA